MHETHLYNEVSTADDVLALSLVWGQPGTNPAPAMLLPPTLAIGYHYTPDCINGFQ